MINETRKSQNLPSLEAPESEVQHFHDAIPRQLQYLNVELAELIIEFEIKVETNDGPCGAIGKAR